MIARRGAPQFPASTGPDTVRVRIHRWQTPVSLAACAASGLLLSFAFPPLEWSWLAWVALVPMFVFGPRGPLRERSLGGLVFGLAHGLTLFYWLNEIGFFAGYLLGAVVGLVPALWYVAVANFATHSSPTGTHWGGESARILLPAAAWVALEWLRSWLFTGLPWGFAANSQWANSAVLPLCTVTGAYGISFLIVAVNAAVGRALLHARSAERRGLVVSVALLAALLLLVFALPRLADRWVPSPPPSERSVRVGVAQGNIPQARGRADEVFPVALSVYDRLSRSIVEQESPDLLLWPETAVPASLRFNEEYAKTVRRLCQETETPLLIGSTDYRFPEAPAQASAPEDAPDPVGFNSAFLIGPNGVILDHQDKTHLVPFGEYTPFERWLPFLTDWIGMGTSLQPGLEFNLFRLPGDILAGVNICYEDCFPHISREFTKRGAEVLLTMTNDAWYAESAGSRQHLIHAVFRAVENRRPLLRSGNNSDSCLILADGTITGLLYDEASGNRFIRAAKAYEVRAPAVLPLTFYTRFGDVFAGLCVAVSLLSLLPSGIRALQRKRRLFTAIRGVDPGG